MQRKVLVGHPNLILETFAELAVEKDWSFDSNPKRLWGANEWDSIVCVLRTPKWSSHFHLQQMPGCCAVLIAFYIEVVPITQEAFDNVLKAIEEAAYYAGFGSLMMAQVVHDPTFKTELWGKLYKRDWVHSKGFVNAKSGNFVIYLTKDLKQEGKREGLEIKL